MNGSRPNVCTRLAGALVTPSVLRFGRGAPSLVRVPGAESPPADVSVDADAADVDAAVAFEPEPTDGLASTGPD